MTSGADIPYGPERKPWSETVFPPAAGSISAPAQDPDNVYSFPENDRGITTNYYQVPSGGLTAAQAQQAQDETKTVSMRQAENFLGYQVTMGNDYSVVSNYLSCCVNNIGDPFVPGSFTLNSKWMERNVLDYYASLWNAKWPHDATDPETYWGYVLTMGSSEGALYGMWNARDYLQGKFNMTDATVPSRAKTIYVQPNPPVDKPNYYTPVLFYSEDTHYSIPKTAAVLEVESFYSLGTRLYPNDNPLPGGGPWPSEVPSLGGDSGPGSVDIDALCTLVEFFASKHYPCQIVFNYGTTFKGAYDDVETAGNRLMKIFDKYGMKDRWVEIQNPDNGEIIFRKRKGYWIHVDGALGASYMPFLKLAFHQNRTDVKPAPNFDFRLPFVCSIVNSAHKWIGSPWPTGIFMTKTSLQLLPPTSPEYIGTPDTTFAGSRNGLSALIMWSYISTHNYKAQIELTVRCLTLAYYTYKAMLAVQDKVGDLWVAYTPLTLSIHFKKPNDDLVYKYSMALESLYYEGVQRDYIHIYVMGGITKEKIDEMIADLSKPGAFLPHAAEAKKGTKAIRQELKKFRQEGIPKRSDNLHDGLLITAKDAGFLRGVKPLMSVPTMGRGWK